MKDERMRVLLIEDDMKIADFVITGFKEHGFAVDHADNGVDGLHLALTEPYDAAVIDLMLPRLDGLSIISKMRGAGVITPVLILSAKRSVEERVLGIRSGGDDYLVKPFAFVELLVRLQALIRRAASVASPTTLTVADLTLDIVSRKVRRAGEDICLQPTEFSLLEYLMRNAGQIVSKTLIMEHVWDYNFNPRTNVVESRICYLRDKVDKPFEKKLIHTVRGVGYVLRETS